LGCGRNSIPHDVGFFGIMGVLDPNALEVEP
jgi:hypothetical protein